MHFKLHDQFVNNYFFNFMIRPRESKIVIQNGISDINDQMANNDNNDDEKFQAALTDGREYNFRVLVHAQKNSHFKYAPQPRRVDTVKKTMYHLGLLQIKW